MAENVTHQQATLTLPDNYLTTQIGRERSCVGRRILVSLAIIGILSVLGVMAVAGFLAVRTLRPELVDAGLRQELARVGLGEATRDTLTARYGQPEQERDETLSTVLAYPSGGLLLRVGKTSGALEWFETTSTIFATEKGIKLGSTYEQILDAYGKPQSVTPLTGGTRVRYQYGMVYMLEFWLVRGGGVERIVFFKA